MPPAERRKIALFTNVEEQAVISAMDADSIYRIPEMLHEQQLDSIVVEKLGIEAPAADLREWRAVTDALTNPGGEVTIAMVGKYVYLTESYKSLSEALIHAGIHTRSKVNIRYVDSEIIEREGTQVLEGVDEVLVPGGFGKRGVEGKIEAIRFARESGRPYLGICLGMQLAVIEYARNVCALAGAAITRAAPISNGRNMENAPCWTVRDNR